MERSPYMEPDILWVPASFFFTQAQNGQRALQSTLHHNVADIGGKKK